MLLSGAVILGGLAAPLLPLVGFPLAAAGLAGLIFRGRVVAAAFTAGLAVALGTFMAPVEAGLLTPAFVALLFAIGGMRRRSALASVALLTVAFAAGALTRATLAAWARGTTLLAMTREHIELAVDTLVSAAGGDGTVLGIDPETLIDLMARLWPVDYFVGALLTAVVTVVVAGWAAERSGVTVHKLPRLDALDLSPHVLWPFIGAFAFLAAGRAADEWAIATTIGLNLLLGVRILLLAQGLGVASAFYRRLGLGGVLRVMGYAMLVVADTVLPLVSMVGLIDFWANFRKLPREDSSQAERLEDEPGGD